MDIGFVWDEEKYQEVQAAHQVRFFEVVSAFDDPNGYEITDSTGHEDRCMWVGSTFAGRLLAVVYSEEVLPLYRLITAFDAEGRLLNEYRVRTGV